MYENCFADPNWRLRLVLLLKRVVSSEKQRDGVSMRLLLERVYPLLLESLLIDMSSTLFTVISTLCAQTLPNLVILLPNLIPQSVPFLLLGLQRGICWAQHPRFRTQSWPYETRNTRGNTGVDDGDSRADDFLPSLHESVAWRFVGNTFDTPGSVPPAPSVLLHFLLGMFPCNTLSFFRSPKRYILAHRPRQIFAVEWIKLVDDDLLKKKAAVGFSPSVRELALPGI